MGNLNKVMVQEFTISQATSQPCHPIQILEQVLSTHESGCLSLSDGEVDWRFYFHDRHLIYASHSIEPSERLERHLCRLSVDYETLTPDVRQQIRQTLDNYWLNDFSQFPDYQAIIWLLNQYYLPPEGATLLVQRLTQEVLEAYSMLPSVFYNKWFAFTSDLPILCQLNLKVVIRQCHQRLRVWQTLKPYIFSPYQRPYFFLNSQTQGNLSESRKQKFGQLLRGYNFYELSALLDKDELVLARKLYKLIVNQSIILREPTPPYDKLPRFDQLQTVISDELSAQVEPERSFEQPEEPTADGERKFKIVCIDDRLENLQDIEQYLSESNLEVFLIDDPLKALIKMTELKPDLIIIDAAMAKLDSYRLCSWIRKSPLFKTTPLIMLTSQKGLLKKAKARLLGVNDYIGKPLNQLKLIKSIFRYLN